MAVEKIYCADGMHGGVAVLLCGVDEIIETLLNKRKLVPSYKFYLELDGCTFEDWIKNPSSTRDHFKSVLDDGGAELVSGAYTQPFAENIGLESNIRQLQWGKRLAEQALDVNIETYLIQEHAYHVALPQILKQLGYRYIVLRTHWPIWGQHKSYSYQAFIWQGPDGTRLMTIPHYSFLNFGKVPNEPPRLEAWIGNGVNVPNEENILRWLTESEKIGIEKPLATREPDLVLGAVLKDETVKFIDDDLRLQFTTPAEYAKSIEDSVAVTEVMHPDDTDTTLPFGLKGDRVLIGSKRVENLLLTAEKFSTIAYLISGRPYCNPYAMNLMGGQQYGDELKVAWKKLMWAQQHDVWVCGPLAFASYSLEDRGLKWLETAESLCEEILTESIVQIISCVDFNLSFEKAAPIAVFNPSPWNRTDIAYASLEFEKGTFKKLALVNSETKPVPIQTMQTEKYEDNSIAKAQIAFIAIDVPSIGYEVYYVIEQNEKTTSDLQASENKAENSKIAVTVDKHGVTGILLKDQQQQLLSQKKAATRLVAYQGDKKQWVDTGETEAETRLVKNGPVLAQYEITGKTEIFHYRKTVTVYANIQRVDVEDHIEIPSPVCIGHQTKEITSGDWRIKRGKLKGWHTDAFIENEKLRTVIPLNIQQSIIRRNVVYIPSETRREVFSSYDWTDVSNETKGLTLINKGNFRYYYDKKNMELSLILGYSGTFPYSTGPEFHMMRGKYMFKYSLYPHTIFDTSTVNKAAYEANNPFIVHGFRRGPLHTNEMSNVAKRLMERRKKPGKPLLPQKHSFIELNATSGNISTMILEGNTPILRIIEDAGKKIQAKLHFFKNIKEAEINDLNGKLKRRIPVDNNTLKIMLNPYEIATIKLKLADQNG